MHVGGNGMRDHSVCPPERNLCFDIMVAQAPLFRHKGAGLLLQLVAGRKL